jgi:Fibronectin type III domain
MIGRTRNFGRRRRAATCLPLVAAVACAMLVTAGASAWTLNLAQLDNGTCGASLQLGSDKTASSSNTPSFWLMGDGGYSSYHELIDGVSIGTFNSDDFGNVCIRTTSRLADGSHVLTGTELAPHSTYAVPAFTFSVDTVAPAAPSTPALASFSNVPGNGVSMYHNVTVTGSSAPNDSIQVYAGTAGIGGSRADATGKWSASSTYMANGAYSITAVVFDQAGNKSVHSGALSLTINDAATATTTTTAATTTTTTAPTTTTTAKPTTTTTAAPTTTTTAAPTTTTTAAPTTTTTAAPTTTTSPAPTTTTTAKPTTTTTAAPTTTTTTKPVATVASAPTGLTGSANKTRALLNWLAPSSNGGSPITYYVIYRSTTAGAELPLAMVSGTLTSYSDTTVSRHVTYYYRVAAYNTIGTGPWSSELRLPVR